MLVYRCRLYLSETTPLTANTRQYIPVSSYTNGGLKMSPNRIGELHAAASTRRFAGLQQSFLWGRHLQPSQRVHDNRRRFRAQPMLMLQLYRSIGSRDLVRLSWPPKAAVQD